MWISDPITTVCDGHKLPKAAAATRDSCAAWKWFTESSRGSSVVLGNRPYSVSQGITLDGAWMICFRLKIWSLIKVKLVKIGICRAICLAKPLPLPAGSSDEVDTHAAPAQLTIRFGEQAFRVPRGPIQLQHLNMSNLWIRLP